jgi:hypothetical protein
MSISSSAVLARLNISVWTATKLDKTATNNVISSSGATDKAAQVHKNLMAGTHLRKDIADFAAECRLWHNTWTLGWEDRGARLLPTSLFMDYKAQVNGRRAKFMAMVDSFCDNYDGHVQISRNYLGTLFSASDYPPVDEVRSKFGFSLVFNPVPESGHFLLDIPAQELEETNKTLYSLMVSGEKRGVDKATEEWSEKVQSLKSKVQRLTDAGDDLQAYRLPDSQSLKRWIQAKQEAK